MIKLFLLTTLLISINLVFSQNIKGSSDYFKYKSKLGVIIRTTFNFNEMYGSGAIVSTLSTGGTRLDQYINAVKFLSANMNPTNQLVDLYTNIYKNKGKEIQILDLEEIGTLDSARIKNRLPKNTIYEFVANKYHLDEILTIDVAYGLKVTYSWGMTIRQEGTCEVRTMILAPSKKEVILQDRTRSHRKIRGSWNQPPTYPNLQACILIAVNRAIDIETRKYQNIKK